MASLTERMIGAAMLDVKTYEEVEADKTATGQAMTVVIVSSLAAGVGSISLGLDMLLWMTLAALVGWFVWAGLTFVIGTKLLPEPQTRSDIGELLRTIGFSTAPGVLRILGFIPFLGALISFAAGVWMLVAMVVAVRQALDYKSTGRAVGVCLIGFIIYMVVLGGLLSMVMGGAALTQSMF
jgi:hypothetical protein